MEKKSETFWKRKEEVCIWWLSCFHPDNCNLVFVFTISFSFIALLCIFPAFERRRGQAETTSRKKSSCCFEVQGKEERENVCLGRGMSHQAVKADLRGCTVYIPCKKKLTVRITSKQSSRNPSYPIVYDKWMNRLSY